MAVVSSTTQFTSATPLGVGATWDWTMYSIPDNASVAITAIPSNVGGMLAVENVRVIRQNDQFGDPIRKTVLCSVRNVGQVSVPRHVINYAVITP
jgi:hypothetical protein